jgi:hypothetical protein
MRTQRDEHAQRLQLPLARGHVQRPRAVVRLRAHVSAQLVQRPDGLHLAGGGAEVHGAPALHVLRLHGRARRVQQAHDGHVARLGRKVDGPLRAPRQMGVNATSR